MSEDSGDECESPEEKLLNMLIYARKILSCCRSYDLQELYKLANEEVQADSFGGNIKEDSIILDSGEIKQIFLSNDLIVGVTFSVGVLLDYLLDLIQNHQQSFISCNRMIVNFATEISNFLQVCEKNEIVLDNTYVVTFLTTLIAILEEADGANFTTKGADYQLIVKVIVTFKEVKFTRQLVLSEICKKLKKFLVQIKTKVCYMHCYESLLHYLKVLKEFLFCYLQKSIFDTKVKESKIEENTFKTISSTLSNILPMVSYDYVKHAIQESLSLLS